jgi:hypothetical protein
MENFEIPAEYCVALVNLDQYVSFVGPDWKLDQLKAHFVDQMKLGAMLAWGTGASGNWRIQIAHKLNSTKGTRDFTGTIVATGDKLYLTSYDELTMAAQFDDVRLPRKGTEDWFFTVEPGTYKCRIVQLYDPEEADSEEVFNQETPHFVIEIQKTKARGANKFREVPWFEEVG